MPETSLPPYFWREHEQRGAYEALLLRCKLPLFGRRLEGDPGRTSDEIVTWMMRAPRALGLDPLEDDVPTHLLLERLLRTRGPSAIVVALERETLLVTAIFESSSRVTLLTPAGEVSMSVTKLHSAILEALASGISGLATLYQGIPGGPAALATLLAAGGVGSVGREPIVMIDFELGPSHDLGEQLRFSGAWRKLTTHVALGFVQVAVATTAIWALGSSAADGRIDAGRILGWSLLVLSDSPLHFLTRVALGGFSMPLASSLKRRILEGSFHIDEREIRSSGFGELSARVSESSVIEQVGLAEASGAFLALCELVGAAVLLAYGTFKAALLLALLVVVGVAAFVGISYVRTYLRVYEARIALTDDLVDKILGHRTRAVQEKPSERHAREDDELAGYADDGLRLDALKSSLASLARGWMLTASVVLLVAFVLHESFAAMLWSALGITLAYRAFASMVPAFERLMEWYAAWRGVRELLKEGYTKPRAPRDVEQPVDEGNLPVVLSVSGMTFSHQAGSRPIFNNADLRILAGEKVLLEGTSGSGKSTLFKLIAGERNANGGVVLVGGTDRFSVSEREWRQRVGSAPQFHENFVFANTLAFNLDPRGNPQVVSDDAKAICEELGLTPVIARMPQGYAQILGETGWQLSHGEKSRLFIARALLQRSDLLLFDESFGALDPATLLRALDCVRRRARTIMVIAHV